MFPGKTEVYGNTQVFIMVIPMFEAKKKSFLIVYKNGHTRKVIPGYHHHEKKTWVLPLTCVLQRNIGKRRVTALL